MSGLGHLYQEPALANKRRDCCCWAGANDVCGVESLKVSCPCHSSLSVRSWIDGWLWGWRTADHSLWCAVPSMTFCLSVRQCIIRDTRHGSTSICSRCWGGFPSSTTQFLSIPGHTLGPLLSWAPIFSGHLWPDLWLYALQPCQINVLRYFKKENHTNLEWNQISGALMNFDQVNLFGSCIPAQPHNQPWRGHQHTYFVRAVSRHKNHAGTTCRWHVLWFCPENLRMVYSWRKFLSTVLLESIDCGIISDDRTCYLTFQQTI